MRTEDLLAQFADDLASVVPEVDSRAEHDRWQEGIGPFEEERQLSMLRNALDSGGECDIRSEVPYPDSGERCDIVLDHDGEEMPIEAKLIRFRYDNGNVDPNSFAKVFSPFPERSSGSLLTDAKKLDRSSFRSSGGLLGLYYEKNNEPYEHLTAENIAEKLSIDSQFWHNINLNVGSASSFENLQHPVHQRGAVIVWEIKG